MLPTTDSTPISMLLAGQPAQVAAWHTVLMADARFRIGSFATDADDLNRKLAGSPDVVIVDASIFQGPPPLIEALTRVTGVAYVVLPAGTPEDARQHIAGIPAVKGVYIGDTNIAALVTKIYTDAQARRTQAPDMAKWMQEQRGGRPSGITGLRIISVWNQCGGAGKSTIASNLAYETARRGLRTLLVGLGAPDTLPLTLALQAEPNITLWQANPTNEAFKNAVQRVGDLEVIAGFPTVIAQEQMVGVSADKKESLNSLVMTAAYTGYGVIILDTPHAPIAALSISTANTLLLVARPTLMDTWSSVEAYRTVQGRMAGQHRIAPENMYVALNRLREKSGMSSNDWHNAASGTLKRSFPPVLATFGDDPDVEKAQNDGKLPIMVCKEFARSMNTLTDLIFGSVGKSAADKKDEGKGFSFGGMSFKIGK